MVIEKKCFRRRLFEANSFSKTELFRSSLGKIKLRFIENQIENMNKKAKGKRYSIEDKVLSLALYKQSGTGYRLPKIFDLPSKKTLTTLLNRIPISPGLNSYVLKVLKAEDKGLP